MNDDLIAMVAFILIYWGAMFILLSIVFAILAIAA